MRSEAKAKDARWFGLDRPVKTRPCDCPGCAQMGEFRAPKDRSLRTYYWFCLDHVRAYNTNWDYFAGMDADAIEAHIRNATCWERETHPIGAWRQREAALREKMTREFFTDIDTARPSYQTAAAHVPATVVEALATLGLQPPIEFIAIKAAYKALVKQHHPDANGGSMDAEARFKDINQAFTLLRQVYETVDTTADENTL